MPTIVIGLGAQLPNRSHPLSLKPGTEFFVNILSKRNIPVFVRGEMTMDLLRQRGVENTYLFGCPSNLINPRSDFLPTLVRSCESMRRVVICPEINSGHADVNRQLMALTRALDRLCIIQDPKSAVSAILSRELKNEDGDLLVKSGLLSDGDESNADVFLRRFRVYFDAVTWMYELRMCDFSIGTKFHGNMLAFQTGIPSFFIMHDTRTEELAETMLLPRLSKSSFLAATSLEEVIASVIYDASAYMQRRRELGLVYASHLHRLGVAVAPSLLSYLE